MDLLQIIICLLAFFILLYGLLHWKQIKASRLEFLILLQACSLLAEIGSEISIILYRNNALSFNLYTLAETPLILFLIGSWTSPSPFSKFIRMLSTAFFLFWLAESFYITRFTEGFNDRSILAGGLLCLLVNAIYLYRLSNESYIPLVRSLRFWISSSFLIYFSVSTILLSSYQITALEGRETTHLLEDIHLYIHIFTSSILLIALLCLHKPRTSRISSSFSL
ncbi:MAG: hypothetical protein JNL88_07960 [Bacteroidia bacterium]|nr:hypothetical protein [Bacteroidia bacterium]